jgi:hypothetical protein
MDRRLIVGILLLALAWQSPVLAYSSTLASPVSTVSGMIQCTELPPNGNGCDGCCSHNPSSCATACAFPLSAVVPTSHAPVAVTIAHLPAPHTTRPALIEHHPARLLRPPIV